MIWSRHLIFGSVNDVMLSCGCIVARTLKDRGDEHPANIFGSVYHQSACHNLSFCNGVRHSQGNAHSATNTLLAFQSQMNQSRHVESVSLTRVSVRSFCQNHRNIRRWLGKVGILRRTMKQEVCNVSNPASRKR